jgi:hypothetical protein
MAEKLLGAITTLTVATGIVNIWVYPSGPVAAAWHRVEHAHPGRLLLGIGAGHREVTSAYTQPYQALTGYLDALEPAPADSSSKMRARRTARRHPHRRHRRGRSGLRHHPAPPANLHQPRSPRRYQPAPGHPHPTRTRCPPRHRDRSHQRRDRGTTRRHRVNRQNPCRPGPSENQRPRPRPRRHHRLRRRPRTAHRTGNRHLIAPDCWPPSGASGHPGRGQEADVPRSGRPGAALVP